MTEKLYKAFTLIELLVVVAIIGLLIALAATAYIKQISKGFDARRKADLNRIKIAVEEYEKDHNCYPPALTACGYSVDIPIHPYLSNVPCDPHTKGPYIYETDGQDCAKWFRIYTVLENKNDAQILEGIGPGSLYNFYVSSPNAPQITVGGSVSCPYTYGCIDGTCVQIEQIVQGSGCEPICTPTYGSCLGVECIGTNECIVTE